MIPIDFYMYLRGFIGNFRRIAGTFRRRRIGLRSVYTKHIAMGAWCTLCHGWIFISFFNPLGYDFAFGYCLCISIFVSMHNASIHVSLLRRPTISPTSAMRPFRVAKPNKGMRVLQADLHPCPVIGSSVGTCNLVHRIGPF